MFTLLSQDVSLLTKETTQIFLLSSKKKLIFDIILQSKQCKIIHVNINLICEGKSVALYVQNDTFTNSTCFSVRMMAFWPGYRTCAQSGPTSSYENQRKRDTCAVVSLKYKNIGEGLRIMVFLFSKQRSPNRSTFHIGKDIKYQA